MGILVEFKLLLELSWKYVAASMLRRFSLRGDVFVFLFVCVSMNCIYIFMLIDFIVVIKV